MLLETERILTEISERANLAEGTEGVRSILFTMFRYPKLKNKKVAQKTGIAIPALAAVRGELVKARIIEKKNYLGEGGRDWIRKNMNLKFDYDPLPNELEISIDHIPTSFDELNTLEGILENRPEPNFALDQSHAIYSTILKRTLYILKKGDIEGRRIILLGDDDTTSIALGMLDLAEQITVIEIDPEVIQFLRKTANQLSLKGFKVISHDLRDSCPPDLLNKYDIAITDPPYTNEGLRLFLKRVKQVLRSKIDIDGVEHKIIGKKCYLSFGNKPPEENLQIQSSILDHGFTIQEMIPFFNRYKGASIIGQFSHLYYLQLTGMATNMNNLSLKLKPIYTSEVKERSLISFRPVGYHFVGEMHFETQEFLMNNKKIDEIFIKALNSANVSVIDIFRHNYNPYGYSAIAILKTSHATIHTWPEHGYLSIDIFICDEFSKGVEIVKILKKNFKPIKSEFFYMERGMDLKVDYKPIKEKKN